MGQILKARRAIFCALRRSEHELLKGQLITIAKPKALGYSGEPSAYL